jgi:hypothetical protein
VSERDAARDLIDRLATDLQPVRVLAPLPLRLAGVLLGACLAACLVLAVYPLRDALWETFASNATWASVLVGLALAGVGGLLGALASVIPGREKAVWAGAVAAGVGLTLSVGASAAAVLASGADASGVTGSHLMCIPRGACFALLPAAVAFYAAAKGWSGRPGITVCLALLGAGAFGALLVHLTCPATSPLHVLCTHTSTPLILAAALTAALLPLMRRWAR